MIQGIIFDCYGVLVHGSLNYLRSLTTSDTRRQFDDLAHASDRGFISAEAYITQVAELVGKRENDIRTIIATQEIRSSEVLAYVSELKSKGYKTAMLSNVGRGAIERLFPGEELGSLFDAVVLSSETGVTKPNMEAYELVAERLGLRSGSCVMIDDILTNVQGAELAGMRGILFETLDGCRKELEQLLEEDRA